MIFFIKLQCPYIEVILVLKLSGLMGFVGLLFMKRGNFMMSFSYGPHMNFLRGGGLPDIHFLHISYSVSSHILLANPNP